MHSKRAREPRQSCIDFRVIEKYISMHKPALNFLSFDLKLRGILLAGNNRALALAHVYTYEEFAEK